MKSIHPARRAREQARLYLYEAAMKKLRYSPKEAKLFASNMLQAILRIIRQGR